MRRLFSLIWSASCVLAQQPTTEWIYPNTNFTFPSDNRTDVNSNFTINRNDVLVGTWTSNIAQVSLNGGFGFALVCWYSELKTWRERE